MGLRSASRAWVAPILLAALAVSGCHRHDRHDGTKQVAAPTTAKEGEERLVILPDSAIAARPGSTEEQLANFLASDQPPPRTFRFKGTEFQPWASKPNPPTLQTMYAIVQILRAYPKVKVTLVGYTDNDGTAEQNLILARQRAERMADLLIRSGIAARRITAIGKGATDFIADNSTEAGRAKNRRIELIVTDK